MEKKNKDKKNIVATKLSQLALRIGKDSVGKSSIWFNQPKVPQSMKDQKKL